MADQSAQSDPVHRPLSGDRPIEKATEDRLGYAPFARAIAASIVNRAPSGGIVYAIHGPWGSGKTSAVNMLVEAVGQLETGQTPEERTIVVRFNPWWFSEQSDLTKTFFSELAATLAKKVTTKVADGLRKVGRQVAGAKELLAGLLSLAPGGSLASPLIKGGLEALQPYLNESDSLDGARQELIDALNEQGRRILVIIDDIDRLQEDEARQIFRLVKSVADLPNVIYLLVFDRDVARRALGEPVVADGPEWLEKIVQASFDLPPVHPIDLRKMLINGINELIGDKNAGDSTRVGNVLFSSVFPWIKTPRDVGRLLNALNVSLPAVIEDVNMADFIAIETLRTFEQAVYNVVRNRQDRLTGLSNMRMQKDTDLGAELLAGVAENRQELIKSSLKRLFPRLASVWENTYYDGGSAERWARERRVCAKHHFPAYFTFGPGDDALRETEISKILQSLNSREEFSLVVSDLSNQKRRNGTTKASLVCHAIQTRQSDIGDAALSAAADTLLHSGHVLYPHHDGGSGFGEYPFVWNYWWTISPMLARIDRQGRLMLLRRAIEDAPNLVALSFVLVAIEGQFGMHEGSEQLPPEERTVDEDGLKLLQQGMRDRIRKMASDGSLIQQPELRNLLLRWAELDGSDAVRAWSAGVLYDDEAVQALAQSALGRGSTHAEGDHVTSTYFHIEKDTVSKYVDLEALSVRLAEIGAKVSGGMEIATLFQKALAAKNRWDGPKGE